MDRIAGASALAVLLVASAHAQGIETKAQQAYMIEAESRTILLSKDADKPVMPASLAKLMTVEVALDAVRSGKVGMGDPVKVSEHAWRTGGAPARTSTMFAALNSMVPFEDLLKGVIVVSANDGAIAIAERLSGSEGEFAKLMNERARTLGLRQAKFANPTGQPGGEQAITMREAVELAQHLHRAYPEYYPMFALPEFAWNKITQRNRNPILTAVQGADGLAAAGSAETGGFTFVGSAERGGQRLFVALGGLASDRERLAEARRIVEWGMSAFDRAPLFPKDAIIGQAEVYGGASPTVPVKASGPVSIFIANDDKEHVAAKLVYDGPLPAPVAAGTPVGALNIYVGDKLVQETPLVAAADVEQGSLTQRAKNAVKELAVGWLR